ncbi:MAG TPA: SPASM domain-containing protein [Candidatus Wunengus sp. YC64]|uniref:SPASM domain-containing protein n=1 Tax=Candidatus Wunengus sp. YC64 TaxID=3367700 RepID=UPI0040263DAD
MINKQSITTEEFNKMLPETFSIETALACDLKCPECALGGDSVLRKKGFMSFEHFKIIADRIRPHAKYLYLHLWGEPMLNKDIISMTQYASEFCKTNISTNGISLTPEKTEELITSGVADIIVSIDGVTQEVYEKYRKGGNVKKAMSSLEILHHFNMKHGNKVHIYPQFVVFKHNQHEMESFRKYCKSLGLHATFKAPYIRTNEAQFSYSDHPELQRKYYNDIGSLRLAIRECPNPQNVFTILLDGSVIICCHDFNKATCFGNIFEMDVLDIWNNPEYRKFRWNILTGNAPEFCLNNCLSYFLEQRHTHSKQQRIPAKDIKTKTAKTEAKINLCCGPIKLDGFINIDVSPNADMVLDLERELLPFPDESVVAVVCMSAINYFSRQRAIEIIKDVFRVLKQGGIARFGTQDLRILSEKYLNNDCEFYFQKLKDGRERFPGKTIADKFNEFFYGFQAGGKHCKYVYDFESLKVLFEEAGFSLVEEKKYGESRMPEIDKIDNRPEQMFFLEAIKNGNIVHDFNNDVNKTLQIIKSSIQRNPTGRPRNDIDIFRNLGFNFWEAGKTEKAWQYLLKVLELTPDDRITVVKCGKILHSLDRYEDLTTLYTTYLNCIPDDLEIKKLLTETHNKLKNIKRDTNEMSRIRHELDRYNTRKNPILPDRDHLDACIKWLRVAQDVNCGGGVSAMYHLDSRKWDVDYPETTGYIIPTFLCYYRLSGIELYLTWAIEMGDWEVEIQSPEGGAGEPVGVYGQRPRVFNTSQVIIGWIALYKETGKGKYLEAANRAADWIADIQDANGMWTRNTYNGPKAYKSRVAWALLELYTINGNEKYREIAERAIDWTLSQANSNGWFSNNSLSDPNKPWTHLIGYVLVGLMEIYLLDNAHFDRRKVLTVLQNAAKGIADFYMKAKAMDKGSNYVTLPGTFDCNWHSNDHWSCVTGNAQIEYFLRKLAGYTNNPQLVPVADFLLDDIKQLHLLDGVSDKNVYGGLPGSYPIGGGYCAYKIPDWGVKFFADSLLQRMFTNDKLRYLG